MKCVVYVINRMSLSPINMKSPYKIIFEENQMLNILEFLGLFVITMCPNLKEQNLMQKQKMHFCQV